MNEHRDEVARNEHALPADHDQRMARARLSLDGLSVGDAFGEDFFHWDLAIQELVSARVLPARPWIYTDDTAMAVSIAEVLNAAGRIDQDALAAAFARRYAQQPDRGYGGTAQTILEAIGNGVPWRAASGSAFDGQGSMGNGGAMRVGPVGAYFADDLAAAVENARASAEVTHTHPDGQAGAIAVAVAAAMAHQTRDLSAGEAAGQLLQAVLAHTPAGPTREGLAAIGRIGLECPLKSAVRALGNGSNVVSCDTVPFCIWSVCRHLRSYEDAIWETVSALGDRDTTCAIVGSIVAMSAGPGGVPKSWIAAREPLPL
jgi:ADP-ribosylglycohydrolase